MFVLLKIIKNKILRMRLNWIREFNILKYGEKADVCVLTALEKGFLRFSTTNTTGTIPVNQVHILRTLIGQNVLTVYGIPSEGQQPPNISLYISFSALWQLGFQYFKFVKDWPGKSEANGITVVTYTKR